VLTLITLGKLKEPFYRSAVAEYEKRMKAYGGITILELPEVRLPENPSQAQIAGALKKEAETVRAKLPKNCWLCVLTPEGKLISSEELAKKLSSVRTGGKSELVFLIGSSFGLDPELKAQGDFRLSMSPMTFPHHLARVMVLEQLYRAESILAGSKYHK
jgi:23S rRNA (pseudouridine1915-N3)-methyltransferase